MAWIAEERWRALPEELASVLDGRHLSHMPSDPVTGEPYRYERLSETGYRLCADFARPSEPVPAGQSFWSHPAGRHCFDFTVAANPSQDP